MDRKQELTIKLQRIRSFMTSEHLRPIEPCETGFQVFFRFHQRKDMGKNLIGGIGPKGVHNESGFAKVLDTGVLGQIQMEDAKGFGINGEQRLDGFIEMRLSLLFRSDIDPNAVGHIRIALRILFDRIDGPFATQWQLRIPAHPEIIRNPGFPLFHPGEQRKQFRLFFRRQHRENGLRNIGHDIRNSEFLETMAWTGDLMEAMLGNIPGGVAVFSEKNGKIHMVYTNDGFYSLHHGNRAFWAARGDDPVDWLEANDRHVFLDEFQKVKNGEKEQGRATYRVDGEDGSSHWVDNQFRKAYEESGVQYYYASFVGLDGLKRAEETRDEARRMYESAVEDSKLVVWEYDIPAHRIIMRQKRIRGS